MLLRGVGSDAELDRRAAAPARARSRCSPVAAAGVSVRLTISIGAVRAGDELDSLDALVEAADRCLYAAKRHGRNRVSLSRDLAGGERRRTSPSRSAWRARSRSPPAFAAGRPRPRRAGRVARRADGAAAGAAGATRAALPARGLAARRRQGRDPGADPRQAGPARRRRVGPDPHASDRRRGHGAPASRRCARPPRPSATTTSATTAAAIPTASRAPRSRSRPGSSPRPTRSRR